MDDEFCLFSEHDQDPLSLYLFEDFTERGVNSYERPTGGDDQYLGRGSVSSKGGTLECFEECRRDSLCINNESKEEKRLEDIQIQEHLLQQDKNSPTSNSTDNPRALKYLDSNILNDLFISRTPDKNKKGKKSRDIQGLIKYGEEELLQLPSSIIKGDSTRTSGGSNTNPSILSKCKLSGGHTYPPEYNIYIYKNKQNTQQQPIYSDIYHPKSADIQEIHTPRSPPTPHFDVGSCLNQSPSPIKTTTHNTLFNAKILQEQMEYLNSMFAPVNYVDQAQMQLTQYYTHTRTIRKPRVKDPLFYVIKSRRRKLFNTSGDNNLQKSHSVMEEKLELTFGGKTINLRELKESLAGRKRKRVDNSNRSKSKKMRVGKREK